MLSRRALIASSVAAASGVQAAEPAWIDAHAHVFVRGLTPAANARYAPDYDASWQTLLELAAKNGVGRAVILQP
jgi:predicted TIM-barrel fold metal-dependent hydrolase